MDPHPIVVVGSGLAAWTTIKELRKHDAQVPVVMVTATSGDAYPKPALSTAFAQGKEPAQLRQGVAADLAAANQVQLQAQWLRTATSFNHQSPSRESMKTGTTSASRSSLT